MLKAEFVELKDCMPEGVNSVKYSMFGAFYWANHLGKCTVDLYGCDWKGAEDWRGFVSQYSVRDNTRWKREGDAFDSMLKVIPNIKSITVIRAVMHEEQWHPFQVIVKKEAGEKISLLPSAQGNVNA